MRWLEWLISVLVWLSADPVEFDRQAPRAAAAVAAARASMTADDPAPPAPRPECVCGKTCVNGYWKPDGKILQKCECTCDRCKSRPAAPCPDGKCPPR
jgi:hypothetical protein